MALDLESWLRLGSLPANSTCLHLHLAHPAATSWLQLALAPEGACSNRSPEHAERDMVPACGAPVSIPHSKTCLFSCAFVAAGMASACIDESAGTCCPRVWLLRLVLLPVSHPLRHIMLVNRSSMCIPGSDGSQSNGLGFSVQWTLTHHFQGCTHQAPHRWTYKRHFRVLCQSTEYQCAQYPLGQWF